MKKLLLKYFHLIVILLGCMCEAENTYAYEVTIEGTTLSSDTIIDGIAYDLQNYTAAVANSGKYEGVVTIPRAIEVNGIEYKVASIQASAFYKSKATEIILPEGLEYIGAYAFQYSELLERVVIPKSVRYVGNMAFVYCTSLKELDTYLLLDNVTRPFQSSYTYIYRGDCKTIPASFFSGSKLEQFLMYGKVEEIGDKAFGGCGLKFVKLSNSLKIIGDGALAGNSIETITLPKSLEKIGDQAFVNSKLNIVIIDPDFNVKDFSNTAFDGCPFGEAIKAEAKAQVAYLGRVAYLYTGTSDILEVKDGTVSIADNCFQGCNVQKIKLPGTVRYIGKNAFHGLKSTFEFNGLLEYIGDYAFEWCENLGGIPPMAKDAYLGVDAFRSNTFYEVGVVNYVGTRAVSFQYYSDDISHVKVKDGTTEIAAGCFSGRKFKTIELPESLQTISDRAFEGSQVERVVLPSSITHIGEKAFYGCKELCSVELSDNLLEISDYAFAECPKLEKINIPESVIRIGDRAFYDCSSLLQVEGGQSVRSIGDYAFFYCKSLSIFPFMTSQIERIGQRAFYNCKFSEISLPKTVVSIGYRALSDMPLKTIALSSNSIDMGDGVFYNSQIDLIDWNVADCTSLLSSDPTVQRSVFYGDKMPKFSRLPISSEIIAWGLLWPADTNVKEVMISDNVRFIDVNCFWTDGIEKITSYAKTPPIVNCGASNPEKNETMIVSIPKESYPLYSKASYWRNFKKYVDLDGNPIELSSIKIVEKNTISIKCENRILYISNIEKESLVEIFDYTGVLRYIRKTNDAESTIPLNSPGIYIIRINQEHYKIRVL